MSKISDAINDLMSIKRDISNLPYGDLMDLKDDVYYIERDIEDVIRTLEDIDIDID